MNWEIYAVKDELTQRYKFPTFYTEQAEAKRDFKTQVNNTTLWKSNPGDFSLYKLATFNDETGEYNNQHELICNGRSVLNAD